jgi:hypothetical protein
VSTVILTVILFCVKKFIKLLIGLFLLPFGWALSRAVFALLTALPSSSSGWTDWALPAGFAVSVLGFFVLPRPFRTYVLAHELTHAVWGLLMGAKVGKMKVGPNGGHVMLSKSNFLISLAPYFFPFYTGLVIAVWFAAGFFFDLSAVEPWWLAAVGLTWGFHVTFTVYMLSQCQPDVQENGRIFSYVIIYLANLFFISLWIVALSTPTFSNAWTLLSMETCAAYTGLWTLLLAGWAWFMSLHPA